MLSECTMESFENYLEELIRFDGANVTDTKNVYKQLVEMDFLNLEWTRIQEIIKKIYVLVETNKVEKHHLFITLLVNRKALDLFIKYEKITSKLNINDSASILNYIYFFKKHWFMDLLENIDDYAEYFSEDDKANLIALKVIYILQSSNIDLNELERYLNLDEHRVNDVLLHRFIENIRQKFNVIKYIKSIKLNISLSNLLRDTQQMNILEICSTYLDLKTYKLWPEILTKLKEVEKYNTDQDSFIAYTVLINVMESMDISKRSKNERNFKEELNKLIETCKPEILQIKSKSLQVELLEDIFTLIFSRPEHFGLKDFGEFYCTDQTIRLILNFLKHILEELKKSYTNQSDLNRFVQLQRMLTDACWRYELVSDVRSHKKDPKSAMKYMLSTPEALISMCLKRDDLDRANQVIQVFNLQKSHLAHEINYSRYISSFKRDIRNIDKQDLSTEEINSQLKKAIEKHINNSQKKRFETSDFSVDLEGMQQKDIDILDVLINLPIKFSTYKCLSSELHDTFNSTFPALSKIYDRIQDVTEQNYVAADKLHSHYVTYDVKRYFNLLKQYGKLENAYNKFKKLYNTDCKGTLNIHHILNETLLEIQDICIAFRVEERKEYTQYMQKLLKYLQEFAKILFSERNNADLVSKGRDVSVFEILKFKKADITCSLLYNRNLDGAEFDDLFCRLKLDLPYHISYISFPQIIFDIQGNIESCGTLQLQKPRQDVINYVQKRSWFLAFLINHIHGLSDSTIEKNEVRVKVFVNLMNLPDIKKLKMLFNNNETLAILHQDYSFFLKNYFDRLMLADDASTLYDEGYMKLNLPKNTTWKSLYELVLTIPERDLHKHDDIYNLRDILLCNLIKEKTEENYWEYVRYITNNDLKMRIILEELQFWPGEFCVDILKSQISNYQQRKDMERLMLRYKQVEIYMKIKQLCGYSSWFEVDKLCLNEPRKVMVSILETTDMDILMNFFFLHPPHEDLLLNITEQHLLCYFQKYSFYKIQQLLDILPKQHCIGTCMKLFPLLKNLPNLNFIVNYLLGINEFDASLKNIQISSRILQRFSPDEVEQLWNLIEEPLSILEMLLMNTRLEKFGEVYSSIQHDIENTEFDESALSIEKIDELLREYAEKSLEFKVVGCTSPAGSTESKLMISIDSICLEPKTFVMPNEVPDKSNWIPDNEIEECMCCRHTKFSMFNRRHHCRRCGRVVCWSCSSKRMLVEKYGDILVRVCNDCFNQSQNDDSSTFKSVTEEYWTLTGNIRHDKLVRQEFAYENAPSVMLCLSILKHHSKSEEYPRFLLQQCENILTILRPHKDNRSEEIDYNLIIKMLKSLAIAAKVMSNQCLFQWGASLADKIMSQAEMLGLLAENRYLDLLPAPSKTQSSHLNTSVLRSVRDKLLEQEQWNLALEVSTKAGLDTTGIFAMWGKSFLQAGNLQLARQKFKMCFEKNTHFDLDRLSYSESHLSRTNRSYYRSISDNKKMLKDPLLLTEIVQILESKVDRINSKLCKQLPSSRIMYESTSSLASISTAAAVQNEEAICIMNDLMNLEAIEQGNFALLHVTGEEECQCYRPHLENLFYEECVYYLSKYGSSTSLCQFYIRHKDFTEALIFIHRNNVSVDVFIEVYIDCLKDGLTEFLHKAIVEIDPSFDIWKEYIKGLCIYMEKHAMLNSLYQLQQFIGDFVRAALTCIKFYSRDVTSFCELSLRDEYLYKAQEHLKQVLEQEQWVDVTAVMTSSCSFLEEKPITNAALVMKLDHKSVNLHINTIDKQVEIVKYLAEYENAGHDILNYISMILFSFQETVPKSIQIPTLFGKKYEKIQLAILLMVISGNTSIGFNMAQNIIKEFKINPRKVYTEVGKLLAKSRRLDAIRDLVKCIYSHSEPQHIVAEICDEMLIITARTLAECQGSDTEIETTIKFISNLNIKINTYIETKQLRSGFLLAAKHNKTYDVVRIRREAELLNRQDVIKLCEKYLESHPQPVLK